MHTDDLLTRALNLESLTADEGVFLFENAATAELMYVGNRIRQGRDPRSLQSVAFDSRVRVRGRLTTRS